MAGVREQSRRMQEVVYDYRFENIELEVALRTSEGDRGCRPMNLDTHHRHGLTLSGIHLARHDRGARLILWNRQFAKTATRTGSQPTDVVGNFHERGRQSLQPTLGEN